MKWRAVGAWVAAFAVIFNLGYVFHEIIARDFFAARIGGITRERYLIPLVALSFAIYVAYLVYLFPLFERHYRGRLSPMTTGALMGGLIGFLWDGLQGGMIEVATFRMPVSVFFVDSAYHTLEGVLAGVMVAWALMRGSGEGQH